MAVAVTKDQNPLADLDQRWSELVTPNLDRTEVAHLSAPTCPIDANPNVERATRRDSNARWFVSTAMLAVGLLAGYAAGVATATRNAEDQSARGSGFAAQGADSEPQRADFRATAGPLSTGVIAGAVNDELRNSEPDSTPLLPLSNEVQQPPVPPPANKVLATGPGVLHLESHPTGAQVHLDDRLVATTPFRLYDVPPGSHRVRMELQGYQPWSTSVNVEAGSLARIAASLEQ
jgi:hypothetical protein